MSLFKKKTPKPPRPSNPYKHTAFAVIVVITLLLAFLVKGVVLGGMLTGLMSSIAVWIIVLKTPIWLQDWMGRHTLLSDLLLTLVSSSVLAMLGPGITMFVALVTQAVILSVLLQTL